MSRLCFFVVKLAQQTPWLDGKHVVFGQMTSGADILDKMEAVGSQAGQCSKPADDRRFRTVVNNYSNRSQCSMTRKC
jgi:cyclophilin family peptidyl-prolyl cis-trans isomerase